MAGSGTDKPRIHRVHFAECDHLSELARGGDVEFLQVGRGVSRGSMTRIDLEGLHLFRLVASNQTVVHGATRPEFRAVSAPLSWEGAMRWNGLELDRPSVLPWGERSDFTRQGRDVSIATLCFDRDQLLDGLRDWTGQATVDWDHFQGVPFQHPGATSHFLQRLKAALRLAERHPAAFESPAVRNRIRDDLLASLFQLATVSGAIKERPGRAFGGKARIVARARDFLAAHQNRDVSLMEICHATAASARSVEYAFKEIIGATPIQYLRLRRLNLVRKLLREASPDAQCVSQCARSAGFSHLGRFAVTYRKFFGESPSSTLNNPPSDGSGTSECARIG